MLFTDAPVLTGLAGRDVTLFLKEMGEFVVHASLPELAPEISAARGQGPGHSRDARAAAGRFGGYYLVGPVPAVSFPQAVKRPGVHEGLRPWPWQPGVDPFVLMVHSLHREQLCLVVDGQARPVTDEALGSWLRVLPELSASSRPLEDPLVLLTCSRVDARQGLADQLGRLVWFPHGDMSALFLDPAGRAPGAEVRVGLHHTQDGRGGRFTSVYPQGPAGDRVRWAYRSRFPADPTGWLVERSAPPGAVVPAGLRPYLFGGPRTRGLCYFDRRDHRSRFAALNARLGSSHVAWTPNHAYQPGIRAPIDPVTARPWHSRELGRLPFDLPATAVVAGYFADGRFAVYDVRQDLTYWETPSAFGRRLRRDLTAAGDPMPSRVLLLTDFDAVPALARQQIMPSLDGTTLITANTPATLFLDETAPTGGVPTTRIALLPAEGTVGPPVWTATTSAGTSTIVARPADIRVIPTTSDTRDSGVSQRSPGEELGRVRMPVPVGLPVPAVARSAGGKAALVEDGPLGRSGPQEWFEILDREGAGIVTYRVSSWGRIGIPGWANPVPGVGWAQWGHDLIHPSTGVVLRGHTGWIGRLTAAELPDVRSALAAHGAEQFTLSATPAGIFATPAGGGRVWQIPFHGHVRRAAPTTTPEPGRPGRPLPTAPELTEDELSMLAAEVQKELRTLRKPGMARMVVAREDVRAIHSHLDPSLWQHPLSKQGTKIAQYWVSGHQNGVQLPGAGQSVEAEWMNPIEVDPFGSDLEDDGSIDIEEVLEEVLERHGTAVLARCRGAEVTLDVDTFFQDDQGRLHTTEEGASASMVQPVTFGYPELVLWVMPHLPGEVRDISLEEGRAIYRMVSQAMAEVPGAGGDGPNTALAEVLRPQDGWEMTALGRAARIGPLALGSDRGPWVQFNVGVPAETGYLFGQYLQAHTFTAFGVHTLAHRGDGLAFADEVAAMYLSWRALRHISDQIMDRAMSLVEVAELSVQAVRSHVFSAYIHAAALFTYPTSWDPVKYHAAELTRLEPKKLRRALPDQSQEFLRLFSEKICRLAITRVTERLPDRVAHAESQSVTTTEEVLRDSDDKTRLYWEATLTDQHDHRDVMKYCFDRMTVLDDFDVVDGMPLVVKEVRAHGDRKYPTYTEMARAQDQIADAATHAYVVAKRLHNPTPEMLADFEAALQELRAHGARLGPGGGGTQ